MQALTIIAWVAGAAWLGVCALYLIYAALAVLTLVGKGAERVLLVVERRLPGLR